MNVLQHLVILMNTEYAGTSKKNNYYYNLFVIGSKYYFKNLLV